MRSRLEIELPTDVSIILERFGGFAKKHFGTRLRYFALFGSYARGDATPEESDIDVFLVLDELEFQE